MNEKLTDARQMLAACGWTISERAEGGKLAYVVVDQNGVPRRSFVPVERLWDYARGVFDSQKFQ
jgi:nitrogen fixation protein FixH